MIFERSIKISFIGVDIDPVSDLRIQFSAEKHDTTELNRANIIIFNLSEKTRNALARPYHLDRPMAEPVITVTITAGYKGSEIVMFVGDLVIATNERSGPDWRTVMQLFTGYNATAKSWTELSLGSKTDARAVVDSLLNPLNLDAIYTEDAAKQLQGKSVSSYASSGLSFRTVHDFLTRYGLAFTIEEDNQALIYVSGKERDPNNTRTAQNTFSKESGLIGTPQVTSIGVNIRALLRPSIKILQKFYVESQTITNTLRGGGGQLANEYYVNKVAHFGDNRGQEWYTEIEGVYLSLDKTNYEAIS